MTALVRLQIRKHAAFGSTCVGLVATFGTASDPRYAVVLPEGWGVQSIAVYDDIDCTVASATTEVVAAEGTLSWNDSPSLVPDRLSIDVALTLSGGIGRPGYDILRATDVPVTSCG